MTSSTSNTNTAQNGTTSNSSNTSPWSVQSPFIQQAFNQAQGAEGTASQFTPAELNSYSTLLNAINGSYGNATSASNTGTALGSAGTNATTNGLYQLASYNPAATNNTSNVLNTANQYVSGSNIPAQVAAAMVPAEQAAAYGASPMIDRSAAATGNINSSRDAIEHGLLSTTLGQQANALSEQLGANAFNTGAATGENMLQSNNSNSLAAALGLTQGGTNAASTGTNAGATSIADLLGIGSGANTATTGLSTSPFAALNNYYNIVGANNWGGSTTSNGAYSGTGTSDTTTTPSIMSTIGSLLGGGASLLGSTGANGVTTGLGGISGVSGLLKGLFGGSS